MRCNDVQSERNQIYLNTGEGLELGRNNLAYRTGYFSVHIFYLPCNCTLKLSEHLVVFGVYMCLAEFTGTQSMCYTGV